LHDAPAIADAGIERAGIFGAPVHLALASARPVNAMSVDVEEHFQVSAFEGVIERADWPRWSSRVEANVERILAVFADAGVRATFFTLGWIAERHPACIRRICDQGHELASHGYEHTRVIHQTPEQFRTDVTRAKAILEDLSGRPVLGYRAASYSITRDRLWALDVLEACGHRYSSSIYPVRHDLYGIPEAPRFAFRRRGGHLLEIPVTTCEVLGRNWPCGGGGYFRLLPYAASRWALARVNRRDRQPAMFYFHPWEIDPDQPRVADAPLKSRVRHYLNLARFEPRLKRLLREFRWDRVDRVFLEPLSAGR
jgi:polysaccharide deacetylase family protein (PEP-CTERM system associated)